MMWKKWMTKSFVSILILGCVGLAKGQVTTGRISGTVIDPNGAVVQGANVTATSLDTNSSREATTDGDGNFAFQLLPPGRYKIEVTASGFQKYEAEAVVNITQTTAVAVQLGVAGGTATVTVEPEAPVLQTETSQNGRVIEGETIRQLPLATRNFTTAFDASSRSAIVQFPPD